MAEFIWKSGFCVGEAEIDLEHKSFFDLLNDNCLSAYGQKCDKAAVKLANDLFAYADKHFTHEEDLMRNIDFPLLPQHQKQHQFFLDQVKLLTDATIMNDPVRAMRLKEFLRDWFLTHILDKDMEYIPYLQRTNAPESVKET